MVGTFFTAHHVSQANKVLVVLLNNRNQFVFQPLFEISLSFSHINSVNQIYYFSSKPTLPTGVLPWESIADVIAGFLICLINLSTPQN
jgi:hypothetical protein